MNREDLAAKEAAVSLRSWWRPTLSKRKNEYLHLHSSASKDVLMSNFSPGGHGEGQADWFVCSVLMNICGQH